MASVKENKNLISEKWPLIKSVLSRFGYEPTTKEIVEKYFTEDMGCADLGRTYGKSKQYVISIVTNAVKTLEPFLQTDQELMRISVPYDWESAEIALARQKALFPTAKLCELKIRRIKPKEWDAISETLKITPKAREVFQRYYVDGEEIVDIAKDREEKKESVLSAIKRVAEKVLPLISQPLVVLDVTLPVNEAKEIIARSHQIMND